MDLIKLDSGAGPTHRAPGVIFLSKGDGAKQVVARAQIIPLEHPVVTVIHETHSQ